MTRIRMFFAAVAVTLAGAVAPATAEVTPSHVYQLVDDIQRELDLILSTVGKSAKHDAGAPAIAERQPRHVIQEARELLIRIEQIHGHHDLPEIAVPAFPIHEITPSEVREFVDLALEELRELKPAFGVTATPEPAPLPSGKTPTDVYGLLHEVGLQLDSLGETGVKPYHIYHSAMTVLHELDGIWEHLGRTDDVHLETHHGKSDQEAYDQAYGLLEDIRRLTQEDRLAIPGGVVLLERRAGAVTQADIMELLNAAIAELGAVKTVVGSTEPVEFGMPAHTDRLPTNAFDAIFLARAMIGSLLGS